MSKKYGFPLALGSLFVFIGVFFGVNSCRLLIENGKLCRKNAALRQKVMILQTKAVSNPGWYVHDVDVEKVEVLEWPDSYRRFELKKLDDEGEWKDVSTSPCTRIWTSGLAAIADDQYAGVFLEKKEAETFLAARLRQKKIEIQTDYRKTMNWLRAKEAKYDLKGETNAAGRD